jgi:glycerophosphoryl diester phosphodiesterase
VQVHAHRGGSYLAPENTQAAFANAVELGVHFIELDVRQCATGELIVSHDPTLSRTGGVDLVLAERSLDEIQSVDVGSHFAPRFADERVPTFLEVLETWRDQVRFNIEIKEETPGGDGSALAVGELIASMGLYSDVIVSSFNPFSLRRVRSRCQAPLGLLYPPSGGKTAVGRIRDVVLRRPWTAPLLSVYALHPRHDFVTAEGVKQAHSRGLAVNTWTVNEPARIRQLASFRVSSIISDRPDLALQITRELDPLARKGAGLPE